MSNSTGNSRTYESLVNEIMLLKEDIECFHKWLDDKQVPREENNQTLSMVGRVKHLSLMK